MVPMMKAKSLTGKENLIPREIDSHKVMELEIINSETDKFTMIHNRLLQSKQLTAQEKFVYITLKSFCFDTDITWVSEELLEYITGITRKTVRKYIGKLCELRLVSKLTIINKVKTQRKSYYLLLPPHHWKIEDDGKVIEQWKESQKEYEVVYDNTEEEPV